MSRRASLVVIALLGATVAGAVALQTGGGRLREWILALHGIHAGHGSAQSRHALGTTPAVWPQTSVGQLARRWVEAFSSGEDALRRFLDQELTPASLAQRSLDQRLESYRALHERFGRLTLASVGSSHAGVLELSLNAADGSPHAFTFEAQTEPPFKLLAVELMDTQTHTH